VGEEVTVQVVQVQDICLLDEGMGQERVAIGLDEILEPDSCLEFQYQSVQDPSAYRLGETYPVDLRSLLEFLSDQHPGFMSQAEQSLVQLE
jgi:hypothetical protein